MAGSQNRWILDVEKRLHSLAAASTERFAALLKIKS